MRTIAIGMETNRSQRREAPCETRPRCSRTLAKGAVQSFENRSPVHIKVEKGCLWLTVTGDGTDYVLRPGQTLTLSRRGRIVVQAMTDSRFATDAAN